MTRNRSEHFSDEVKDERGVPAWLSVEPGLLILGLVCSSPMLVGITENENFKKK